MSIKCHNSDEINRLLEELNNLLPSKISIKQDGNIFTLYKRQGKSRGIKTIGTVFGPANLEANLRMMIFEQKMK